MFAIDRYYVPNGAEGREPFIDRFLSDSSIEIHIYLVVLYIDRSRLQTKHLRVHRIECVERGENK